MNCSFPNCDREERGKCGLCNGHRQQKRRGEQLRDLRPHGMTIKERFGRYINTNGPTNPKTGTSCHVWTGAFDGRGYGQIRVIGSKSPQKAHRVAWELHVGTIPEGHVIDHDNPDFGCSNPACVNTKHLEAVPKIVNDRRRRGEKSSAA